MQSSAGQVSRTRNHRSSGRCVSGLAGHPLAAQQLFLEIDHIGICGSIEETGFSTRDRAPGASCPALPLRLWTLSTKPRGQIQLPSGTLPRVKSGFRGLRGRREASGEGVHADGRVPACARRQPARLLWETKLREAPHARPAGRPAPLPRAPVQTHIPALSAPRPATQSQRNRVRMRPLGHQLDGPERLRAFRMPPASQHYPTVSPSMPFDSV